MHVSAGQRLHPSFDPLEARTPRRPVAAAALCAALVFCIYHIPGSDVASDALRCCCAAVACLVVLAAATRGATSPAGGRRAQAPGVFWAVLACTAASTAAGLAGTGAAPAWDAWSDAGAARTAGAIALFAASCLGTALWEETFFRHLLPAAVRPQLPAGRAGGLACALVCAGLFALLHTGAQDSAGALAARFAQTALFGLAMAGVAARRHGLARAVGLHALYDAVSLGGAALCLPGGPTALAAAPADALLAAVSSPAGIAVSLAFLVPLALWACRSLLAENPKATPASA